MIVYADLRWSWQKGAAGIDNVKRELLKRAPSHVRIVELQIAGAVGSPLAPLAIARALDRQVSRPGIFWSPGFMPPAWSRLPTVATVHDLMHLKHYTALHRTYYDLVLKRLYQRCSRIVCVSEYTRNAVLAWSRLPAERVITVYNGVAEAYFDRAARMSPFGYAYVLYAGNRRRHKNLDRLMLAYASSSLPSRGVRLVLTGGPEPRQQRLARALAIERFVHFAGRVSDADMPGLYSGARLVALVSLDEGFGLPILEAMASGVPVLTSDRAAMAEVAGGAALLADPLSIDSIRRGLETLAFDCAERETRIGRGYARARQFRWDAAAAGFWSVLDEVAGELRRA